MVILYEKDPVPPPPYFAIEHDHKSPSRSSSTLHLPSSSSSTTTTTSLRRNRSRAAPTLPSHVLLIIIYSTLPVAGEVRLDRATGIRRRESSEEMAIRTTRTLYWMAFCLRAVSRGFYLASMHLLRSTFLSHYMQCVRAPYSSDPFPHTSVSSVSGSPHQHSDSENRLNSASSRASGSVVSSMQCESEVLDLYILHQLHEDVFADDTSLYTSRPERLRDLFDFMQPRARLMDLVRGYGVGAGLISLSQEGEDGEEGEGEGWVEVNMNEDEATTTEKGDHGLGLKDNLSRSTSTLTLINPASSSSYASSSNPGHSFARSPSPAPSQVKFRPQSYVSNGPMRSDVTRRKKPRAPKIPYTTLRITFSPRRVGLVYSPPPPCLPPSPSPTYPFAPSTNSDPISQPTRVIQRGPRTIADIPRERDEPLERTASRLVAGLKVWVDGSR